MTNSTRTEGFRRRKRNLGITGSPSGFEMHNAQPSCLARLSLSPRRVVLPSMPRTSVLSCSDDRHDSTSDHVFRVPDREQAALTQTRRWQPQCDFLLLRSRRGVVLMRDHQCVRRGPLFDLSTSFGRASLGLPFDRSTILPSSPPARKPSAPQDQRSMNVGVAVVG